MTEALRYMNKTRNLIHMSIIRTYFYSYQTQF